MAIALAQDTSAGVSAALTSPAVLPITSPAAAGELIIVGIAMVDTTNLHTFSVSDNGANTTWHQLSNQITPIVGDNCAAVFWRVSTAGDVGTLTTVSFAFTGVGTAVTGGGMFVNRFNGFTGVPTLDLSPTSLDNSSAGTTTTITGGVAAVATELAFSVIMDSNSLGTPTGTNTYSPNNGTNTYTWTQTSANYIMRGYALPTAAGATASKFIMTWTQSRANAAWGATFYDSPLTVVSPAAAPGAGVGVKPTVTINVSPTAAVGTGIGNPTTGIVLDVVPSAAVGVGVGMAAPFGTNATPLEADGVGVGVNPTVTIINGGSSSNLWSDWTPRWHSGFSG